MSNVVLLTTLEMVVPFHIDRLRDTSSEERKRIALGCVAELTAHGDVLQFGGEGCAEAFNALARGLAVAAYQPGGATFHGRHWCVDHDACVRAEEAA